MRVLHVVPYFAPAFVYGGPPRSVLGLCRALQEDGVDVRVMTTTANGDGELPEDVSSRGAVDGVPVDYLPRAFPKRSFRAPLLAETLARRLESIDLVHIHGCWNLFNWTAARTCRDAGKPYVLSPRGMLNPWSFSRGVVRKRLGYVALERPALRRARFLHATSADEADALNALHVDRPVVTIPNGIADETLALRDRAPEFRRRLGIAGDRFVVLFLGRIHPKKGLELLIDGFRRATANHPNAHLVIAGAGEPRYEEQLRAAAADLVIARRVIFTGHLAGDDRLLALSSANAFALTSFSENFGLGVGEALAAGLPVIVTKSCPWPSVEAWGAGWWVDATADAVSGALQCLLASPELARAMGERGRRAVLSAFDWQTIARDMRAAYGSIN